jgi:acyl-CoA reductase-like NAD-dependent aldehyde dehydrogenase
MMITKEKTERLKVLKTYKLYIGGEFPRTESGRYFSLKDSAGNQLANVCTGSRKDFRNAMVMARGAFGKWSKRTAFNRSQIIYRIAEILESRKMQFVDELMIQGSEKVQAETEVNTAIDLLIYYAGWADKYQQLFSSVNPVAASYFNFSLPEPMGVISVIAPEDHSLFGMVSMIAPIITGGNTCVLLASSSKPLCAVTFGEVLNASDVPSGVVNILTGTRKELLEQFCSHMDVNAVFYGAGIPEELKIIQTNAALNIKRVAEADFLQAGYVAAMQDPYLINNFQETKTIWHPVGI